MILQAQQSQKMATEKVGKSSKNKCKKFILKNENRLAREQHDSVSQQLFARFDVCMSAITESNLDYKNSEAKQLQDG